MSTNFSKNPAEINLPPSFDLSRMRLVLGNYPVGGTGDRLTLKPYEARIYIIKED
jgi:hypothetical protein